MAALLANMVDAELEHARHARAFQDSAMDKHMPKDEIRDYAPNEKDDILYLLEEVNRTARRTFDALIVGLDLNQTQWRIIASLLREPTLTQTEISRLLELESATIGQAVAVLVEKGLIERERAAHDRRVWNLHLTEQVRTIWPELRDSTKFSGRKCLRLKSTSCVRCFEKLRRIRSRLTLAKKADEA